MEGVIIILLLLLAVVIIATALLLLIIIINPYDPQWSIRPQGGGGLKVVRTGQGLKNNLPSFSIQLIFRYIYEQSQILELICALVLE